MGENYTVWTTVHGEDVEIAKMRFPHARNVRSHIERMGTPAHLAPYLPNLNARIAEEPYPLGGLVNWLDIQLYRLTHPKFIHFEHRRYGR